MPTTEPNPRVHWQAPGKPAVSACLVGRRAQRTTREPGEVTCGMCKMAGPPRYRWWHRHG